MGFAALYCSVFVTVFIISKLLILFSFRNFGRSNGNAEFAKSKATDYQVHASS